MFNTELMFKQLNSVYQSWLVFYKYFIFTFTSSSRFYTWLLLITLLFVVSTFVFGFLKGALVTFIFFIAKILWLIHGMHGVIHILEDYVFDKICKIFFVFLANLILLKALIVLFVYF